MFQKNKIKNQCSLIGWVGERQALARSIKSAVLALGTILMLSFNSVANAKEIDALAPIINLLLTEPQANAVECPTPGGAVIKDGILISFDGLLNERQGSFFIDSQQDVDQLDGVTKIDGDLFISSQSFVFSQEPEGSVLTFAAGESAEIDLSPLAFLLEVTGSVFLQTGNVELNDFNCLEKIGESLVIQDNVSLESVNGFQSLAEVGNDLSIIGNEELRSIDGFEMLDSVGSSLTLTRNSNLLTLGSLASLSRKDVAGDILVVSNASLNCTNPVPDFGVATFSKDNAVNCPEDLLTSRISVSNDTAMVIPDIGSVSSSITAFAQSGITGDIRSLEVSIDIAHTSVGNLTVSLSNGVTSIDLLSRPAPLLSNTISFETMADCGASGFDDNVFVVDGFDSTDLGEFIRGASDPSGTTCFDIVEALNSGLMGPSVSNMELLNLEIISQCTAEPFLNDDFLASELDSFSDSTFTSFVSVDADCVADLLSTLGEGVPESCSSNNISVTLLDDRLLQPVNSSCMIGDDSEAYLLPAYSPLESLSVFEGDSINQTWTLTVTDKEGGDVGTLNSWSILFNIER